MRKPLLWIGFLLLAIGLAVIAGSAVLSSLGFNASYNLGDPAKFEFILVPFWQIGLLIAAIGGVCLFISRRKKAAA
jgi:hypothetical protein